MILQHLPSSYDSCDVCIVGCGPVGMALALELESLGRKVVILESGGYRQSPELAQASRATLVNPQRHAPMEIAVCRALGGTSWAWGGRCVAFDEIDFCGRDYVPNSGWPIGHEEIQPWYARAAEYLLCGNDKFHSEGKCLPQIANDISVASIERWSKEPRLGLVHGKRLKQSKLISVFLNTTVVDLDLDPEGRRLERVVIAGANGRSKVQVGTLILAGGGVETTRLLLSVQRKWRDHFGGMGGPLGRYYMGHISGKISDIVLRNPKVIADFDFEIDEAGAYVRRRFLLSDSAQRKHRLLNTAFFPDNAPFYDARHRSSLLSAVFLALAVPPLGRRLVSEAIRLAHIGPEPHHYRAHVANVLRGAPAGIRDLMKVIRDRFLASPPKPSFLVRNREGRYALHYHAEQEPNFDSRIVLIDERDSFGLPRVAVDLRFTDADARSVIRSHQLLDAALRANSVGQLEYWYPEKQLHNQILAQATDGLHQVGTTRMGQDARDSVVDRNLQVHSLLNLYIASSSVFPTTGQANSTLLATALAVRLAHHLNGILTGDLRTARSNAHALC